MHKSTPKGATVGPVRCFVDRFTQGPRVQHSWGDPMRAGHPTQSWEKDGTPLGLEPKPGPQKAWIP